MVPLCHFFHGIQNIIEWHCKKPLMPANSHKMPENKGKRGLKKSSKIMKKKVYKAFLFR